MESQPLLLHYQVQMYEKERQRARRCCLGLLLMISVLVTLLVAGSVMLYVVFNDEGNKLERGNAITGIKGVPSAPEAPTLLASNYTSLTVSWMHPKAFNESSIIKYEVRLNNSVYTTHWTHLTIGNLLAGATYTFAVRALTILGWTVDSHTMYFSTQAPRAPDAPSLFLSNSSTTWLYVTWKVDFDGGREIFLYRTERAPEGSDIYETNYYGSLVAANMTKLTPYTHYHIRVAAENKVGIGNWSDVITFRTNTEVSSVPNTPDPAILLGRGYNWIEVSWNNPKDNGAMIAEVEIRHSAERDFWVQSYLGPPLKRYNITGLFGNTEYYIKFRVRNSNGWSFFSQPVSTKTQPPLPPSAPPPPWQTSSGPNYISLAWDVPADNGAPITGYQLQRDASHTIYVGLRRSAEDLNLNHNTGYKYRVRAQNNAGWGSWSEESAYITAGICGSLKDLEILEHAAHFVEVLGNCGASCFGSSECTSRCLELRLTMSTACATCFGKGVSCDATHCWYECFHAATEKCCSCAKRHCLNDLMQCTGLPRSYLPVYWDC